MLRSIEGLALIFGLGASASLDAAVPPVELKHVRLNVIASESMFPTVNRYDAIASMKVVLDALANDHGFKVDSTLEVARSAEEMAVRIREKLVDLLIIDTPDYLSLHSCRLVELTAVGTTRDGQPAAYPCLLLAREKVSIADLRGNRVVVSSRTKSNMGSIWLDTLLADHRLGRAKGFFDSIVPAYRSSACVLPLFFGKIDACVVNGYGWDLVRERNPQLAKLVVLARSQPLLEGGLAMSVHQFPYRSEMIESILDMHRTPAGQQLVLLFKSGPLMRGSETQFDSVRLLLGRYARLPVLPTERASGRIGDQCAP
jgi:ABC-type phosphate/phosphonate transport system substrate-binding protein